MDQVLLSPDREEAPVDGHCGNLPSVGHIWTGLLRLTGYCLAAIAVQAMAMLPCASLLMNRKTWLGLKTVDDRFNRLDLIQRYGLIEI
jgi:hypothetical protein